MNVKQLIEHNKSDADEIVVVIEYSNEKDFLGNSIEKFFGFLSDVPEKLFKYEVIGTSRIVNSSEPKRIGANCILVK